MEQHPHGARCRSQSVDSAERRGHLYPCRLIAKEIPVAICPRNLLILVSAAGVCARGALRDHRREIPPERVELGLGLRAERTLPAAGERLAEGEMAEE